MESFSYNPNDFVLIYQNSTQFSSIWRFIYTSENVDEKPPNKFIRDAPIDHKIVYEQANPTGIKVATEDGKTYILNVGPPVSRGAGTKSEWVNAGIDSFLFDNSKSYLYCHKGRMGMYNMQTTIFVPFIQNNEVYEFFYAMMSLRDNQLNYVAAEMYRDLDKHRIIKEMNDESDEESDDDSDSNDEYFDDSDCSYE